MLRVTMNNDPPNPSQLCIRNATAGDAASVVRLIRQLGEAADITEAYVLKYLAGSQRGVLIAQRGNSAHGLLSYSVRADLFHAGNSVLIEELIVDKDCRGDGIGSALMHALFERLPMLDCREVCLAVMPDNQDAIRFYKRHGLVEEALFLERHF